MANVNKLTIASGTYDIEDSTGRTLINNNTNNIQTNSNSITKLESVTDVMETEIDTLQTQNPIKNRYYLFIGDSYTTGYNPDESINVGWCDYAIQYAGLTKGKNAFVNGKSGAGFYNANGNFVDLLNYSGITDKSIITDIIVCGGVNDAFSSESNLISAFKTFATTAKSLYPNAVVHVGMLAGSRDISIKNALPKVCKIYEENSAINGMAYIANCQYIAKNHTRLSSDGVHPLDKGYKFIGRHIANYILNGNVDVVDYFEKTITVNSSTQGSKMKWSMRNGTQTINFEGTFNTAGGLYTDKQIIISVKDCPFNGYGTKIGNCTIIAYLNNTTTVSGYYNGYIILTSDYIFYQAGTTEVISNISPVNVIATISVDSLAY